MNLKEAKKPKMGKKYLCFLHHAEEWKILEKEKGGWRESGGTYVGHLSEKAVSLCFELPNIRV